LFVFKYLFPREFFLVSDQIGLLIPLTLRHLTPPSGLFTSFYEDNTLPPLPRWAEPLEGSVKSLGVASRQPLVSNLFLHTDLYQYGIRTSPFYSAFSFWSLRRAHPAFFLEKFQWPSTHARRPFFPSELRESWDGPKLDPLWSEFFFFHSRLMNKHRKRFSPSLNPDPTDARPLAPRPFSKPLLSFSIDSPFRYRFALDGLPQERFL